MTDPIRKNNVHITGNTNSPVTMVFAHGFGTDQSAWSKVSAAFANDYRMILYDNVGAGGSDPEAFSPNRYDSLHSYADDLIAICDRLSVSGAVMVGHSVSGMISVLASIKRPDLFSKLVLVGASPCYCNNPGYTGGFDQPSLDQLYEAMNNNYFAWVSGFAPMAMGNPDRPDLAESFGASLRSIRPDIAQSVARVIFQSDHRSDLASVRTPTLLIQAREDVAVPQAVAEYLHKHISESRLVVINATGHFPHISAPEEVIASIQTFI